MLLWMIEIWIRIHVTIILQHCNSIIPKMRLQGMTNNVRLTLSVGDTAPELTTNQY
jgi:hypothetical protein